MKWRTRLPAFSRLQHLGPRQRKETAMAFEEIECVKPVSGLDAVPDGGLRIKPRAFKSKHGIKHWIEIRLGIALAKRLALTAPQHKVRLLFGTGEDAGKILLAVDGDLGKFLAKRDKQGRYTIVLGAASADGLFAADFPVFAVLDPEVMRAPGCPVSVTFAASAEMLAVDD